MYFESGAPLCGVRSLIVETGRSRASSRCLGDFCRRARCNERKKSRKKKKKKNDTVAWRNVRGNRRSGNSRAKKRRRVSSLEKEILRPAQLARFTIERTSSGWLGSSLGYLSRLIRSIDYEWSASLACPLVGTRSPAVYRRRLASEKRRALFAGQFTRRSLAFAFFAR